MIGLFQKAQRALAKFTPTHKHGSRPGPLVTAIASMSGFSYFSSNSFIDSKSVDSFSRIFCLVFNFGFLVCLGFWVFGFGFNNLGCFRPLAKTGTQFFWCSRLAIAG